MYHDRFWTLLAKKLSGEASAEEIEELTSLIKAYPELSYPAQTVADLWKLPQTQDKEAADDAYHRLQAKMGILIPGFASEETSLINEGFDGQPERKSRKWLVIIIGIITLSVATFFLYINLKPKATAALQEQIQEILTRPGTRTKVVLPDSSIVWLNAGSKLTYTQPFGLQKRTVNLVGEAYFDVVKNQVPFIIHTNGAQIKVLGTAFNVRSYPAEKKIETSLVHGRVEISLDRNPEDKFYLKPAQKLTLNLSPITDRKKRRKELTPLAVFSELSYLDDETIAETSWVENKLVFDDESFEEVANKMERWYGVSIEIKYEKLRRERYTGVFKKETVWQALEAMRLITPFQYTVKNNEIIITH